MTEPKQILQDFERMRNFAEAKAWSNLSLERPLTNQEFEKYKNVMGKLGIGV